LTAGVDSESSRRDIAWAAARLAESGLTPKTEIIAGDAEAVIAARVVDAAIDLLVMGAYGHSRIRTMIVGSTTTQLLRACEIPVLMLR
jgi:nucleotide-binding universal stress UspA family protein